MTVETMDFDIELLNSSTVKLSDYKGKPILLDFFATWCGPCKTQITELQKIQAKFPNVHILSISIEPKDTIGVLQIYSSDNSMDWFVGRDHTQRGSSKFYVSQIPTMAFFNSQGIRKYADHLPGITSEATMTNWITAD
jgi:thiol-disulfide isomerase/thioredoxin